MTDPLHYIHPSISSFHTARTSTPWLITIFYLCFTSIHSWDGPNPSPFCLLCAIMNLGQSSNSQYPLSLEPRHFLLFSSISGLYLMGTSNLGFNTPFPFSRGYSKPYLGLAQEAQGGRRKWPLCYFLPRCLPIYFAFSFMYFAVSIDIWPWTQEICDDVMNFLALILLFA